MKNYSVTISLTVKANSVFDAKRAFWEMVDELQRVSANFVSVEELDEEEVTQ